MSSSSSSSSSSSESEGHRKKFKKHKEEKKERNKERRKERHIKHKDKHKLKHGEPSGLHALGLIQDVLGLEDHKHGHKHEAGWSGHIPAAGVIHQQPRVLDPTHDIILPPYHEHSATTHTAFSARISGHSIPLGSHSGGSSASGHRVPLQAGDRFPSVHETGPAPFLDSDGGPVFIGSALFERSVHPCKIVPNIPHPCRVPYAGEERLHHGRYDLLPFIPSAMEWVTTSDGRLPMGRHPIEGGYEEDGSRLYHAAARIGNVIVPGKTGHHLGGACLAFGDKEHYVKAHYEILCWK